MSRHRHPTGSIPTDYERVPTPVMLVNPDGSRRRDDTDDSGKERRGMSEHQNACWLDDHGPGFRLTKRVDRMHTVQTRLLTGLAIVVFLVGMVGGPLVTDWLRTKHAEKSKPTAELFERSAQAGQTAVRDAGNPARP